MYNEFYWFITIQFVQPTIYLWHVPRDDALLSITYDHPAPVTTLQWYCLTVMVDHKSTRRINLLNIVKANFDTIFRNIDVTRGQENSAGQE